MFLLIVIRIKESHLFFLPKKSGVHLSGTTSGIDMEKDLILNERDLGACFFKKV